MDNEDLEIVARLTNEARLELYKSIAITFSTPQGKETLKYLLSNYFIMRHEFVSDITAFDLIVDIITKMKMASEDEFKKIFAECI